MNRGVSIMLCMVCATALPGLAIGQGTAGEMKSLQTVLDQLYTDMLPLCSKLIGVGRALAGFAAVFYIGSRVWRQIAQAEPIDLYPLFRPFVIGFVILIFPSMIAMINGVMQPTVSATKGMVKDSDLAIAKLLEQKEQAIKSSNVWQMYVGETGSGDRDKWYQYTHPDDPGATDEGVFESIGNDIKFAMAKASYNFRNSIKQWMSEVLKVLFEAAALCINTIRTFYLIVLAILGPLVFGLAVFDGFQHTITIWIARYINIFLWLPVANIFGAIIGKIQENMLKTDISQISQNGDTFFSSTDSAYLVFMIIGIIGYFTVPSVANYIVHAGGANTLLQKVTSFSFSSAQSVIGGGSQMVQDVYGDAATKVRSSMSAAGNSNGYFQDKIKG